MTRRALIRPALLALTVTISAPAFVCAKVADGDTSGLGLTRPMVSNAVLGNTAEQLLRNVLGTPTDAPLSRKGKREMAERLSKLRVFLRDLVSSDPALAGETANALASLAWDTAPEDPETALEMAKLAMEVVSNPAVINAAPENVVETIVTVAGANQRAIGAAASKNIKLTGTDTLRAQIQAVAIRVAAVMDLYVKEGESVLPAIQSRIDDATNLADFTTEAGPGDVLEPLSGTALQEFETATGASPVTVP